TTLQRDANRLLGYTAQQTLDYLQSLYEKKLCTYPRTDSRCLTDDMLGSVPAIVLCAAGIFGAEAPGEIHAQQVCNSKKVSDHHAILPTMAAGELDLSSLPTAEQNILKLISRQVLMAVSGAYRCREAEITIACDGTFKATMKMLLDAGWKKYGQKSIPQKWFSGLEVGQVLTPSKVSVKEGKTQPPHHYTEDLLLSAMETAGAKDMPEDAERKGLGTPATRAGILEKLVSTGMLERRKVKKQTILIPTALGNALITVLPEQLQSPLLTAEWEHRLSQVQKCELEPEDFLAGIREMLTGLIADYRPVSGADILFPSVETTVGKCPRCGRPVIERSKGYFCTNNDCKFVLWRDSRFFTLKQKTLDRKTAQLLLEKGRAPLKGCVSAKNGTTYDAAVILEDDGEKAHFKLVFGNG
ncbi:MAG: DNA topoisomerase, partial [Eubacteriales bacterium]|nr:DNA topoisomerase [Eubacteriales bacterium]